ncbi:MAG TPA: SDR family oxidoreductase [Streptosporangiaceae bacterium]|jgi:3-oxoacyl-[acyl-carrier protein] reductase|nr:SDR family oxidoreductase [Streptosporangiaceae bacterium]
MESLRGQVAIVTGAARGVGLGIATVLREEGADVVLADLNEPAARLAASQLSSSGEHAIGLGVDVTTPPDTARMAAEAIGRWGRIDILAANAGIYPHIALADLQVADLDQIMAVNVRGALLAIQACLPQMTTQGYGRIVLTSSITGSVVGQPGYAHYGATKAAMLGLMRSAALEVASAGITINAVLPGNVQTPGFADLGPEHSRRMLAAIPLGRFAEPEDVGWAVRFLAAGEARYITGQTLIIDGGQVLPESGE